MTKIIRTATQAKGGITAAEKAAFKIHAEKWINNALRTDPVDTDRVTAAIKSLYSSAGLKEPQVIIVPSPIVMAFAGGFSSAILWSRKATDEATAQATIQATDQATDQATAQATAQATRQATDQATRQATAQATDQATRQATYQASRQATDQATEQATRQATDEATDEATDQATEQATRQATYQATENLSNKMVKLAKSLEKETGVSHRLMLSCAQRWWAVTQSGNMWSAWSAYLSGFRDVLGLKLPEHEKYASWEACTIEGGYRYMHEDFCMVSDRPKTLLKDDENRPHCEDGPSHEWRDGFKLWHWHGVRIDDAQKHIIENPERITWQEIENEANAEIRRVMISRYGAERYVVDSGAEVVHSLPVDHPMTGLQTARLLRKDVQDDEPIIYVDLLNSTPEPDGTVKRYMLRVDPNAYRGKAATDCHAAVASTWRNEDDGSLFFADYRDYAPEAES